MELIRNPTLPCLSFKPLNCTNSHKYPSFPSQLSLNSKPFPETNYYPIRGTKYAQNPRFLYTLKSQTNPVCSTKLSILSLSSAEIEQPSKIPVLWNWDLGLFKRVLVGLVLSYNALRCRRVLTVEGGVFGGGYVMGFEQRGLLVIKAWPTFLQVLCVLKQHGLVLSVLLGLSAFFSMAETSITTLWPWKVRELAEKDSEDGVFKMLRNDVTRFLTTILICTTVVNIAATALVTEAATKLFGEAGISAATGVMTVVILLLTEITPKSIAVHHATQVARFVVRPVAWLSLVLYPVGRVVTFLSARMLKLLGLKAASEPNVTEDELKLMLRVAELSGAIEEEEQIDLLRPPLLARFSLVGGGYVDTVEQSISYSAEVFASARHDMIENVLEIKDTHVREVMTPLVDVMAIDAHATLIDFHNLWVLHRYSRVPVFEQRIDNIVGIAYAMEVVDFLQKQEQLDDSVVGDIAQPAYFVPDSMSVWNLLREFRIRKVHMAVVLNEYGGTIGIVTMENVVEEIVGEILDENDSKEEIQKKTGYIVMRADGVFDVDVGTSIDQLCEDLDIVLPEAHQYETVSGFVCEAFGCIPGVGESIKLILEKAKSKESNEYNSEDSNCNHEEDKYQNYKLEISEANSRKVSSVRFERVKQGDLEAMIPEVTRVVPKIMKK